MAINDSLDDRISALEQLAKELDDRDAERDVDRLRTKHDNLDREVSRIENDLGIGGSGARTM